MSILKSFLEKKDGVIWERSPESSREVFWRMLNTHKEEDSVYTHFYEQYAWVPDVHIYIRTEPEECFRRISSRFQDGDVNIDIDYIRAVHEQYETYIK
jgi:thymidylate kinase